MLNSFAKGIKYLVFAFILVGVVFFATPTKGYAYSAWGVTKTIPNGVQLPYTYTSFLPDTLNNLNPNFGNLVTYNVPLTQDLPISTSIDGDYSFDFNYSFLIYNSFHNVDCVGNLWFKFTLNYVDSNNVSQSMVIGSSFSTLSFSDDNYGYVLNFDFPVHVYGNPVSVDVQISDQSIYEYTPFIFTAGESLLVDLEASSSLGQTITMYGTIPQQSASYVGNQSGSVDGSWHTTYYTDSGSFSGSFDDILNSGDITIPQTTFTGTFSLPNDSADYSGTISEDEIDPSGSRFVFGCSAFVNNFYTNFDGTSYDLKLSALGFSPLNLGLNGNLNFGYNNFPTDFLDVLSFKKFVGGVFTSNLCTLFNGEKYPISVIGDTRPGDYCISLGFQCYEALGSEVFNQIQSIGWGFEFNKGQSTSFGLPSNTRFTYTYFPNNDGYYYLNMYWYFTTPDYFDSFLLRNGPWIPSVTNASFSFCKYTGTVYDQVASDDARWNASLSNHSSASSAISSATSTVNVFQTIEDNSFTNLNNHFTSSGIDNFSLDTMSTSLAAVSYLINLTHSYLPSSIKWLILGSLVIGIFAVIISANFYVNRD